MYVCVCVCLKAGYLIYVWKNVWIVILKIFIENGGKITFRERFWIYIHLLLIQILQIQVGCRLLTPRNDSNFTSYWPHSSIFLTFLSFIFFWRKTFKQTYFTVYKTNFLNDPMFAWISSFLIEEKRMKIDLGFWATLNVLAYTYILKLEPVFKWRVPKKKGESTGSLAKLELPPFIKSYFGQVSKFYGIFFS